MQSFGFYVSCASIAISSICLLYLFITIETTFDCQEYKTSGYIELCNKMNDEINQKIKETSKSRSLIFLIIICSGGAGGLGILRMYQDYKKPMYW